MAALAEKILFKGGADPEGVQGPSVRQLHIPLQVQSHRPRSLREAAGGFVRPGSGMGLTTLTSDPTAPSGARSLARCKMPVAPPARQREDSRKNPARGNPGLELRATGP